MGRAPCCSKVGLHRGPWSPKEDAVLTNYVQAHGEGNWRSLPKNAGLLRCGKSCRLRWMNYLRPDIKRGNITPDEDDLIIRMHKLLGNRWSLIAGRLPGRTDNEIKNYWNSHLRRRLLKSQKTTAVLNNGKGRQKEGVKPPETTIVEAEKVKVHNPKATRIKPLSSFSSSSRVDIPCSDSKEYNGGGDHHFSHKIGFLIDDDQDVINGWELEGTSREPMLDKLYDEYLQLLSSEEDDQRQLDLFAETLLG